MYAMLCPFVELLPGDFANAEEQKASQNWSIQVRTHTHTCTHTHTIHTHNTHTQHMDTQAYKHKHLIHIVKLHDGEGRVCFMEPDGT